MASTDKFTERAEQISQEIRDLAADMIEEGRSNKYNPGELTTLSNALLNIEGRAKLLNEAFFELSFVRFKRQK